MHPIHELHQETPKTLGQWTHNFMITWPVACHQIDLGKLLPSTDEMPHSWVPVLAEVFA